MKLVLLAVALALSGCAVYPATGYAPSYSTYDYGYVAPAPAYVAPPAIGVYPDIHIGGGGHHR